MSSSSSAPPSRWSVNSMIAGAGGGLVASIATCPLDVIKTKLQAQRFIQGQPGYLGIIDTIKYIGKTDGFRGYYRGLGPTILGYLPTWAIYFSVYDGVKTYFGEAPLGEETHERLYPAAQPKGYQPVMREHPWSLHILSAMGAGMASTVCTTPLWVIKTRFMTQAPGEVRYRHTLDAARTIYRTEGLSAFYRGLLPSLLGITHVTVQFPLYEHLKIIARDGDEPLTTQSILLCSAASKMVASIVTYPHEVIRTRLQTQRRPIEVDAMSSDGMVKRHGQYGSLWQTVESLVRKEGWSGLYKGLSINLLRTVPNSAVTMLTYELLMRQLSHGARTA
ncbi:mitochondrial carrier [Schizophyllum commune Loenen D]|nr:mitochondrial carrier [Schizophyllum commune Loenen D]